MRSTNINRREFIATSAAVATFLLSDRSLAQSADPTDLSIAQASRVIRSRDLSPVELVRAYLERIAGLDRRLNAFITVTDERALTRAQELETELADGNWRGPLHGIPIALKDNIDTAGVLTTAASAVFENRTPDQDAEVVTRLKEAGAIVLGKLNMHEFAYGGSSTITECPLGTFQHSLSILTQIPERQLAVLRRHVSDVLRVRRDSGSVSYAA